MKASSRSVSSAKNMIIGFIAQLGLLILSFIGRTVFLHYLGIDYLGITGLYTSILSVLSLTELGLGNVILFSLYKPIANNDSRMISALLRYFKRLYTYIAFAIAAIGLLLIPFLKYIIQSELSDADLIKYYLILLTSSVLSYFVAHSTAEITARQELFVIKQINVVSSLAVNVLQIITLILWRNYYLYLALSIVSTLITNYLISRYSNTHYEHLTSHAESIDIPKFEIIKNIKSTFIYKVGVTLINYTDNILISAMIGTVWVGYYSNYSMVVSAIQMYFGIIITSVIPSIGNLNVENNSEKSRSTFFVLLLFFHWSAAFGAISFFFLFGDLIPLWLGSKYLLDTPVLIVICLNFYLSNAINPVWMYREATGLFSRVKYLMLTTAGFNLILSVFLGKLFGLAGILFATALSRILTVVWYEPKILFKEKLGGNVGQYWLTQFKYLLLSGISFVACYGITLFLSHSLIGMVLKALMFFVVSCIIFIIGSLKSNALKSLIGYTNRILRGLKNKINI